MFQNILIDADDYIHILFSKWFLIFERINKLNVILRCHARLPNEEISFQQMLSHDDVRLKTAHKLKSNRFGSVNDNKQATYFTVIYERIDEIVFVVDLYLVN